MSMVHTWGKLPDKGYLEEVPEGAEIYKGDLVFTKLTRGAPAEMDYPPSPEQVANDILTEIRKEGHTPTYIKVELHPRGAGGIPYWTYWIENLTYIEHASPLAPLVIAAIIIAVCIALAVAMVVMAPVIWKWAGLTPEEVAGYMKGFAIGMEPLITTLIVATILVATIIGAAYFLPRLLMKE